MKLAPSALQSVDDTMTRWQAHRPGGEVVFEREFGNMLNRLASISPRGPLGTAQGTYRGQTLWRVLLRKSQQHLYYTIDEAEDLIVVRMTWDARQGSLPRL